MRLICPNCGAQYEVPDDVIPDGGRDVQCSNCGDAWFQKHPSQDRELSEELEQSLDDAHWQDDAPESSEAQAPTTPVEPEPDYAAPLADDGEIEDVSTQWEGFEDPEQIPPEPAEDPLPHEPRTLDPAVSEILRQEAEHEQQARRADSSGGLETQPDLGLEQSLGEESQQDREARLRMARMRGLSEEEALGAAAGLAANASRRDLLPDIEEINSSLRKDTDRAVASDSESDFYPAEPRRGGFSRGFLMMVLLVVVLILPYVYADRISAMLPDSGGVMDGYVGAVDGLRSWLDAQVLALMGWLDGMTSQGSTDS